MTKKEIMEILIEDYSYTKSQLEDFKKERLEEILKKERDTKKISSLMHNFWVIKGMPKPDTLLHDGIEGTQKYAWGLFITWIMLFVLLGLFIFLMVYFFAV